MLSFTILTDTPKSLRDFLVAQGFGKLDNDNNLVGVLPGVEWVEVPNSIVTNVGDPAGKPAVPPTYDTRRCYMVKVAGAAEADETSSKAQANADGSQKLIWQKTKLGAFILANSTAVNQDDASGKTFRGRKVTGSAVWLLREDDAAQISVWQ